MRPNFSVNTLSDQTLLNSFIHSKFPFGGDPNAPLGRQWTLRPGERIKETLSCERIKPYSSEVGELLLGTTTGYFRQLPSGSGMYFKV